MGRGPGPRLAAAALLALLLAACQAGGTKGPARVRAPSADESSEVEDRFRSQTSLMPLPPDPDVLLVVYLLPGDRRDDIEVNLRPTLPGTLPLHALVSPREAWSREGLYVGVESDGARGFAFLVRAGDPRRILTETEDAAGLRAVLVRARGGAGSLRVPDLAGGVLTLAEVTRAGDPPDVLARIPLRRGSLAPGGREIRVMSR